MKNNQQKHIRVTQTGKANATFIVKNPKKIEYWKMICNYLSGTCGFVITTYEELENEK